jgi:hypothetical protein
MTDNSGRVGVAETGSREPSPTVSALSGFDPARFLTVSEAEAQGYTVEHAFPDGRVRSMATKTGYLVVYGAPSYMHAVWRADKASSTEEQSK